MALDTAQALATGELRLTQLFGGGLPGGPTEGLEMRLLAPAYKLDGVRLMSSVATIIAAAHQPNLPRASRILESDGPSPPPAHVYGGVRIHACPVGAVNESQRDHLVGIHFRYLAQRRMAAVALALRLYQLDHDNRPDELADLVPDYLPEIPMDILSKGQPIQYRPGADPPLLYSVGMNGTDDGGKYEPPTCGGDCREGDVVFFLNGDRPRSEP